MDNAACARFDQEVLKYMNLAAATGRKAAEPTVTVDSRRKYEALGRTYRVKALSSLKQAIQASEPDLEDTKNEVPARHSVHARSSLKN